MKNAQTAGPLAVAYPVPARCPGPVSGPLVHRLRRLTAGRAGALTWLCAHTARAAACRLRGAEAAAQTLDRGAETARIHLARLLELQAALGLSPALFAPQGQHKIWWSAGMAPVGPCFRDAGDQTVYHLLRAALRDAESAARETAALADALPDSHRPCAERLLADWLHFAALLRAELLQ